MKGTITSSRDAFTMCTLMLFDSIRYLAGTDCTWCEQILTHVVLVFLSKVVHIKISSAWLLQVDKVPFCCQVLHIKHGSSLITCLSERWNCPCG